MYHGGGWRNQPATQQLCCQAEAQQPLGLTTKRPPAPDTLPQRAGTRPTSPVPGCARVSPPASWRTPSRERGVCAKASATCLVSAGSAGTLGSSTHTSRKKKQGQQRDFLEVKTSSSQTHPKPYPTCVCSPPQPVCSLQLILQSKPFLPQEAGARQSPWGKRGSQDSTP